MRECVYREGKKAKSTIREDAGMSEEIQGGNAEAGKTRRQGALETGGGSVGS